MLIRYKRIEKWFKQFKEYIRTSKWYQKFIDNELIQYLSYNYGGEVTFNDRIESNHLLFWKTEPVKSNEYHTRTGINSVVQFHERNHNSDIKHTRIYGVGTTYRYALYDLITQLYRDNERLKRKEKQLTKHIQEEFTKELQERNNIHIDDQN